MANLIKIIQNIIDDFMRGFKMKKMLGFLINNQEPVGLKALNLSHKTRPDRDEVMQQKVEQDESQESEQKKDLLEIPEKYKHISAEKGEKPKKIQTWNMPSNILNSDFYKSLKKLGEEEK